MLGAAIGRAQRQAGQIEHVEDVGVELLVGQAEADHVEVGQSMAGFEAIERHIGRAQFCLHVDPWRVDSLGQHVRPLVDQIVQDGKPQVAHAEVVDVGKGQRDPVGGRVPILDD